MSHGHGHGHGTPPGEAGAAGRRALGFTLALTGGFAVVEVVVGLRSGSLALLADAGHMVGDTGALLLALAMAALSERPPDTTQTYGYRRAEVLGALINGSVLLVIAGSVAWEAVGRLSAPPAVAGAGLLGTAIGGLVINGLAFLLLRRGASTNLNIRAALWHVIGDALGSVAAIVAGVAVIGWDFTLADPIASLVIATLIVIGAVRLLRETLHVLMEGVPADLDVDAVRGTIVETEGVASVHDLHLWCLSPNFPMVSAHVVLAEGHHGVEVARRVGARLEAAHGISHVTVQPEVSAPGLVQIRTDPR